MRRGQKALVCPGCLKAGVTLRLGSEDWFTCRYCDWSACNEGYDDADLRGRASLRRFNEAHPDRPGSEPEWVEAPAGG